MSEADKMEPAPAAQRQRPLRIVAVGNSHLAAIMKGYRELRAAEPQSAVVMTFVQLNNPEFRPPLKAGKLNPAAVDAIEDADAHALISCVAGNAHNVLGLLNHPTRFDFVLPEQPDLDLDESAELLPYGFAEKVLHDTLTQTAFRVLTALGETAKVPVFHLESPPPIPSAEHIRQIPDSKFSDRIEELGVASAALRYKLWRLHSLLVARFCAEAGIHYIPVPASVQDEQGMLAETCWGNATHGNERFGQALLETALHQVQETIGNT